MSHPESAPVDRPNKHMPVKLLLAYDPILDRREQYFNYVMGEFVPTLEHLGLSMCEAWHTAYGRYPLRLQCFSAPDLQTLEEILTSEDFLELESRLLQFVENYERRIVPQRRRFQF
jgi:hypothetical protein